MKKKVDVSVIIPCFNGEKFIKETIESVQKQTYKNFEIIVVDNGSTDNSYKVLEHMMQYDNAIRLFRLEKNQGGANAWKCAIDKAKGKYIAFLDADDLWMPNKLEKQVQFMEENNYLFTFTKYHWISENGIELNNVINVKKELPFKSFIANTCIGCSSVMIKLTALKKIQIPVYQRINWDFATWGLLLQTGIVANGLNEDLMCYRIVKNSTSRKKNKYAKSVWYIYKNIFKLSYRERIIAFFGYSYHALIRNKFLLFRK